MTKEEYSKYEEILTDVCKFCVDQHLPITEVERLFDKEEFNSVDGLIARIALFHNLGVIIDVFDEIGVVVYFNMFECDPYVASYVTKAFLSYHNFEGFSTFVMRDCVHGRDVLYGHEAIEYFVIQRDGMRDFNPEMVN